MFLKFVEDTEEMSHPLTGAAMTEIISYDQAVGREERLKRSDVDIADKFVST